MSPTDPTADDLEALRRRLALLHEQAVALLTLSHDLFREAGTLAADPAIISPAGPEATPEAGR